MKITEHNINEIKLEKFFYNFLGAAIFFLFLGILSALFFYFENPEHDIDFFALPMIFSYLLVIVSIILFSLSGKRIITISKMTNELVVENNRLIKKNKETYILKDIECIVKKNRREFRSVYNSYRLLKVSKYYLYLKDAKLIPIFSYAVADNHIFVDKSITREKEKVLSNLDIISNFLNIKIKS